MELPRKKGCLEVEKVKKKTNKEKKIIPEEIKIDKPEEVFELDGEEIKIPEEDKPFLGEVFESNPEEIINEEAEIQPPDKMEEKDKSLRDEMKDIKKYMEVLANPKKTKHKNKNFKIPGNVT